MATHRMSIAQWLKPDSSGKVWFEPYPILATNDVWDSIVVRYDEDGNNNAQVSTRIGLSGRFNIPKNYVGSAKFIVVWTSTVTSGNVVWDLDYRAVGGDDSESLDQTSNQESLSVTDAAPTAAHRRLEASMTATDANFAVDDTVEFTIFNDGTDGSDTLAAARLLFDIIFEYADV